MGIEMTATNVTKVFVDTARGRVVVMFSYTTAVAAWVFHDGSSRRYLTVGTTTTTRKHLGQYGPKQHLREGDHCETVSQPELQRLIQAATSSPA